MALANLHTGLGVVGGCGTHALLDLAGHGQERLLDVASVLGRSLEERNAQAVGELLHAEVSDQFQENRYLDREATRPLGAR